MPVLGLMIISATAKPSLPPTCFKVFSRGAGLMWENVQIMLLSMWHKHSKHINTCNFAALPPSLHCDVRSNAQEASPTVAWLVFCGVIWCHIASYGNIWCYVVLCVVVLCFMVLHDVGVEAIANCRPKIQREDSLKSVNDRVLDYPMLEAL